MIERKCAAARQALHNLGIDPVWMEPVSDDPEGQQATRARTELAKTEFDVLIVCLAGWIPLYAVVDVISPFAHKPVIL